MTLRGLPGFVFDELPLLISCVVVVSGLPVLAGFTVDTSCAESS